MTIHDMKEKDGAAKVTMLVDSKGVPIYLALEALTDQAFHLDYMRSRSGVTNIYIIPHDKKD